MAFFKALLPGAILTWIVTYIIGSQGSSGGFLNIFNTSIMGHDFYWSWPLFIIGTGLAWAIFSMME